MKKQDNIQQKEAAKSIMKMDQNVPIRTKKWTVGARPAPFSRKMQKHNHLYQYLTIIMQMTKLYNL